MKLKEVVVAGGRRMMELSEILQKDIRFSNLAGRAMPSKYSSEPKREHVISVWIDDPEILEYFAQNKVYISSKINETDQTVRHSVKFKAYPRTNEDGSQTPVVLFETTENTVPVKVGSFGIIDSAHVDTLKIRFGIYNPQRFPNSFIPAINALKCVADESAGEIDDDQDDEFAEYAGVPFN